MKIEDIKDIINITYGNKEINIIIIENKKDKTYEFWITEEGYGIILFMYGFKKEDIKDYKSLIKELKNENLGNCLDLEYWIERIENE